MKGTLHLSLSLKKIIKKVYTNIQVKIKGGLPVSGRAGKDLGSRHSDPHNEKKAGQNENPQLFLDPSENWGHRENYCPPNWGDRQDDT